jgi:hypothetical protein
MQMELYAAPALAGLVALPPAGCSTNGDSPFAFGNGEWGRAQAGTDTRPQTHRHRLYAVALGACFNTQGDAGSGVEPEAAKAIPTLRTSLIAAGENKRIDDKWLGAKEALHPTSPCWAAFFGWRELLRSARSRSPTGRRSPTMSAATGGAVLRATRKESHDR